MMRKLLKLALWLAGFLIVALLILAIALPIFLDPNDYKAEIVAQVEEQSGRSFQLDGPIEWTVFPWLALSAGPVTLGDAAGFSNDYFLRAKRVSAGLKVLPLLQQRIEIGDVELDGVSVNLAVNETGANNWESLGQGSPGPEAQPSGDRSGYGISVASFALINSDVRYVNAGADINLALTDVALTAGAYRQGQPLELTVNAAYRLNNEQEGAVAMSIVAEQLLDGAGPRARINDLRLTQNAEPQMRFAAALVDIDLAAGTLNIPSYEVSSHAARITGSAGGRKLNDDPAFSARIQVEPFALDQWLSATGLYTAATTDPSALDSLAGEVEWRVSGGIFIDKLRLQLDDTLLRGSASVNDGIAFELRADTLDLDRYLPPPGGQSQSSPQDESPEEPLVLPKIDGALTVAEFKMAGMSATEVLLRLSGDENGVRVLPIRGRAYGGQFEGGLNLTDARSKPVAATELAIRRVDGEALLSSLAGESILSGIGTLTSDLTINEPFSANPLASLNGDVRFEFNDGVLYGVNVMQIYRQIAALADGKLDRMGAGPADSTDFAAFIVDGAISDGVLQTREFSLRSPFFEDSGAGRVDLAGGTVDYELRPRLTQIPSGEAFASLQRLRGVEIPLAISGALTSPEVGFDERKVLQDIAGDQIQDKLREELGLDPGDEEGEADPLKSLLFDALEKELADDEDQDSDN